MKLYHQSPWNLEAQAVVLLLSTGWQVRPEAELRLRVEGEARYASKSVYGYVKRSK
jgi:hypothetical protein